MSRAPKEAGSDALLPCPFCGGEAKHRRYMDYDEGRADEYWRVSATGCRDCEVAFTCWTEEQSAAAWNTRAPSASTEKLVEALKRARNVLEQVTPHGLALEAVNAALSEVSAS